VVPPHPVTRAIVAVTVLVSAAAFWWNGQLAALLWGFTPALVGADLSTPLALPWWVTPWTAALLHGGWLHLILNMVMLLLVGRMVETHVGGRGLILAYVVGAGAAAAAQYAAGPSSDIPMVGASGAISALFGIQGLLYGQPPRLFRSDKANRAVLVLWLLAGWVLINVAFAFLAGQSGVLVATPAHVGGYVAGLALAVPLVRRRYRAG